MEDSIGTGLKVGDYVIVGSDYYGGELRYGLVSSIKKKTCSVNVFPLNEHRNGYEINRRSVHLFKIDDKIIENYLKNVMLLTIKQ